jgi:hypothetical protein
VEGRSGTIAAPRTSSRRGRGWSPCGGGGRGRTPSFDSDEWGVWQRGRGSGNNFRRTIGSFLPPLISLRPTGCDEASNYYSGFARCRKGGDHPRLAAGALAPDRSRWIFRKSSATGGRHRNPLGPGEPDPSSTRGHQVEPIHSRRGIDEVDPGPAPRHGRSPARPDRPLSPPSLVGSPLADEGW